MIDRKPPRVLGDDRAVLLGLLGFQRDSLARKVDGVDEQAARRVLVPSGTTLLWLVKHMARAESLWVEQRFAGRHVAALRTAVLDDRVGSDDTVAGALRAYRDTWARVDAVVLAADLDDRCARPDTTAPTTLRWVLAHLLQETARHAGHADILREQLDGSTGR